MEYKEEAFYRWVGETIASIRKQKNLTQAELAKLLDLSRASVANIEKGRQCPPLFTIWSIAEILGVEAQELLPLKNEHLPTKEEILEQAVEQSKKIEVEDTSRLSDFLKNL
jgi:transcriptional regulator with XRE-family HTH domain